MLARELNPVLIDAVSPEISVASSRSAHQALADEVTAYFDQLRHPLLRYLLSFGLAPHDGEEVIQEVFLSLFQHLRRGGARTNLRGWIFRVAHNLGLRRCSTNRVESRLFTAAGEDSHDLHLDPAPNPEETWGHRQRQQRLLAVVEALPEQDRRCLYLRAEGLRYREITGVLGMSLGAVALSLSRTIARLSRADGR
jgi:RNA polymerase sigma-70 factor (ECF subfamily)